MFFFYSLQVSEQYWQICYGHFMRIMPQPLSQDVLVDAGLLCDKGALLTFCILIILLYSMLNNLYCYTVWYWNLKGWHNQHGSLPLDMMPSQFIHVPVCSEFYHNFILLSILQLVIRASVPNFCMYFLSPHYVFRQTHCSLYFNTVIILGDVYTCN